MIELLERYWIFAIGFLAQALFGLRMLVQWYLSEKKGQSISPVIFWQISLAASFIFIVYGILRDDFVIIFGQILTYLIYIRNLQINLAWRIMPVTVRIAVFLLPVAAILWALFQPAASRLQFDFHFMVVLGTIGQILFNLRFVYQWYHAEKTRESSLPLGFWIITAAGSILILIYAIYKLDPVLLLAQSFGMIVALRNIWLLLSRLPANL